MLVGEKVPVIPVGKFVMLMPITALKLEFAAVVRVRVALPPEATLRELRDPVRVKVGGTTTFRVRAAVFESPPLLAMTVRGKLPVLVALVAVKLKAVEPEPGLGKLAGVNVAVTPAGRPLTERLMTALKPPDTDEFRATLAVPPVETEIELAAALN
jgi:hypothetical protein